MGRRKRVLLYLQARKEERAYWNRGKDETSEGIPKTLYFLGKMRQNRKCRKRKGYSVMWNNLEKRPPTQRKKKGGGEKCTGTDKKRGVPSGEIKKKKVISLPESPPLRLDKRKRGEGTASPLKKNARGINRRR